MPSKKEWEVLVVAVGGEKTAGKYLKATSGWNNNANGQDTYGFSALPGGGGNSVGYFDIVGDFGYWWSASEYDSLYAYYKGMGYNCEDAYWDYYGKSFLLSVRCVQN